MSAIESWCETYVEELWDDLEDKKDWLKDMATKENGVNTHTLIEHVCGMLGDCGLVPEGSFGDAVMEVVSEMEADLACHLDRYIIRVEGVEIWEEVWDKYFPEEADETESEEEEEEVPPETDEDGCDIKCWYCNARGVDKKVNEVWIHAGCESDSDSEEEKEEKVKCVCCNETVSDCE
jgi:hypothetical protein